MELELEFCLTKKFCWGSILIGPENKRNKTEEAYHEKIFKNIDISPAWSDFHSWWMRDNFCVKSGGSKDPEGKKGTVQKRVL
jgi:hypothetical protein